MDSSKDILRVGTFRSGSLVWVTVAASCMSLSPPARLRRPMVD